MDVRLVVFKVNGQRKDFPIKEGIAVIGRGEECELRVPIGTVSRKHCELTVATPQINIKDLGSSNGTYVNNRRITQTDLKAGDRIAVGPVVFTLQIDGVPEEIQKVETNVPVEASDSQVEVEVAAGADEVAELDAEILALSESSDELLVQDSGDEDIDPISALEAFASDSDKLAEEDEDDNLP